MFSLKFFFLFFSVFLSKVEQIKVQEEAKISSESFGHHPPWTQHCLGPTSKQTIQAIPVFDVQLQIFCRQRLLQVRLFSGLNV